ncbi:MAG: sulfate adenylyltransferase [Anaerolineae bacterium]|nr:sulfate adenylyltransferase [Anaerolineae bacterium]
MGLSSKTIWLRSNPLSESYSDVIRPHGGVLVDRVMRGEVREAVRERAERLVKIPLNEMGLSDLEMIATGAYSPLTGFMRKADYDRCVTDMRLTSGVVWSVPVTLAVGKELADRIQEGHEVALCEGDKVLAVLEVAEKFPYDSATKEREAEMVYRTTEAVHPGVARVYRQGDTLLGGDVWLVDWPSATRTEFPELRHTPAETRRMFARRGWRSVVGFQTRNPIHRAHEYIQKTALEIVDGLFLHPLVGETKKDDIPADVRIASYQTILRDYYPADRVVLGVFPAAMRYAGPREAIFHAIARKNYGCTHFIVGRDHAGVGKYYGTYDAQNIFDQFSADEIGITPLKFEHTFYCKKCQMVVSAKTCPHGREDWVSLSGTQVREMLERGEMLPEEFTRPEVAKVLMEGVRRQLEEE